MFKKPIFLETFVLLMAVGVLNYIASINHLYWSVYEFDSVVHFLGGASLAAFFIWLYFFSGLFNPSERKLINFLAVAIIGAMFVAIAWEIYELFLGEVEIQKAEYAYDTMMDLIMDFLGALAFSFYAYMKEFASKKAQGAS